MLRTQVRGTCTLREVPDTPSGLRKRNGTILCSFMQKAGDLGWEEFEE